VRQYEYTIILEPDTEEGGYVVTVPALPGCVTEGDTYAEAIAMARDAIRGYIESLKLAGEPVPEETAEPRTAKVQVAA
jgi:predicted RNase H-like HicB family nuclease